jgi:hypothetical protein
MKHIIALVLVVAAAAALSAQHKSKWVYVDGQRLNYGTDERGNRIMDFARGLQRRRRGDPGRARGTHDRAGRRR